MNDRKRQQQKARRMIAPSAESIAWQRLNRAVTALRESLVVVVEKLSEALLPCMNALKEAFGNMNLQEIATNIDQKEDES